MIGGIYTSATGMIMGQEKMNQIANNLANVNTSGYKADRLIAKSFPDLLLRRVNDDGVAITPNGSFDLAPIVGRLGRGVELNENFIQFEQGGAKKTGNPMDIMLQNGQNDRPAFFVIETPNGMRLSRNGAFVLNKDGFLVTHEGHKLLGEEGPIQLKRDNFLIQEDGAIYINPAQGNDPFISNPSNEWEDIGILDQIQIRTVEFPRGLKKEGTSLYVATTDSGEISRFDEVGENWDGKILQGFLESSNVNLVKEMVHMIEVQRNYEANQKSITTHDQLLAKVINEVSK